LSAVPPAKNLKIVVDKLPGALRGGRHGVVGRAIEDLTAQHLVVRFGCCEQHKSRVNFKVLSCVLIGLGVAGIPLIAFVLPDKISDLVGLAVVVALMIAGSICLSWPGSVRIEYFESGHAWLSGFGDGYRDALPSLEAAREQYVDGAASALEHVRDDEETATRE
jgi:hypothetical protein